MIEFTLMQIDTNKTVQYKHLQPIMYVMKFLCHVIRTFSAKLNNNVKLAKRNS